MKFCSTSMDWWGSGLLLSFDVVRFPLFPCSLYFNRKGKHGLDHGAEASVVPPISPSGGFICGGMGFLLFCVWGVEWLLVAGGWRNTCFQALLKPEGWVCFGGQDNIRLAFLNLNGMFQERTRS